MLADQSLEQLESQSRDLSAKIRELSATREAIDDEIAKRHAAVQNFKVAAQSSPAEIDKLIHAKPIPDKKE